MVEKEFNKFLVFSKKDIQAYLTKKEIGVLNSIHGLLGKRRHAEGRPINHYIVCNQDEPYADKVWQTILEGEAHEEDQNKVEEEVN